jgi:N-hydroxyarylamine O-acetyltransferase
MPESSGRRVRDDPARFDVTTYLERIGYEGPTVPTGKTLRALHLRHLLTVPFENLDIHLGRPIVLDEGRLFAKIVGRRRGGFCYELNGLFAALLRELEFPVTLLAAQFPRDDDRPAPDVDHLVLLVGTEEHDVPWLADVGAGRDSFATPLRAVMGVAQKQPAAGADFRLVAEDGSCRLQRREPGGAWQASYRLDWTPRRLADFEEGCRFHQTSPDSHFPEKRVCTLLTPNGRITLVERMLITTSNGRREERELADEAAYRETLRSLFGVDLDQ